MRIIDWSSDWCSSDLSAEAGREIPEGWALDPAGHPTTDARAALAGSLLPFGGARGANIALMVELLAAGLTGANWSREAPPFNKGAKSPGAGLFILAIDPLAGFAARLRSEEHTSELQSLMRISYAVFCLKKKKTKDK